MNKNGMMMIDEHLEENERDTFQLRQQQENGGNGERASYFDQTQMVSIAIDDFMRSPKSASRIKPYATGPNASSSAAAVMRRQPGVCVAKSYQMLCGRCGRRFTSKLLFVYLD